MSDTTGIVYNNEMDDFSIASASDGLLISKANSIQPMKSPMSSMAPIIVLNDNHEVTLTVGGAGKLFKNEMDILRIYEINRRLTSSFKCDEWIFSKSSQSKVVLLTLNPLVIKFQRFL